MAQESNELLQSLQDAVITIKTQQLEIENLKNEYKNRLLL